MTEPERPEPLRFPTRAGFAIELHETGIRHPAGRWWRRRTPRFTPYREMTHLWRSARGLVIATTRGVWSIPTGLVGGEAELAALEDALREAVGDVVRGEERLARMDALDRKLRNAPRPLLGRSLAGFTCGIFALVWLFPNLAHELSFRAGLVDAGEVWRLVTLHIVHTDPLHLLLNGLALWILGDLAELSIGRARAWAGAAVSAAGAALGCLWMAYPEALGASGIVAGFAGILMLLELRRPETIPAPWRLPRRLFVTAVVADGIILSFVPVAAHAAHLGGFLAGAGFAGVAATTGPWVARPARSPLWVRTTNGVAALAVIAALLMGGIAAADFQGTWERRALALLDRPDASPDELNEAAWSIAIGDVSDEDLLLLAETLAERAVDGSHRSRAYILDTLAEVYFVQGRNAEALAVNEEALRLSPDDRYLREQRRRYKGLRAADDRPDAGDLPDEPPLPELPGIRV